MANPSDIVTIGLILDAFGIATATWWVASTYGKLETQIAANKRDINELGRALRLQIRSENRISRLQIQHVQEHLEKTGYHPPPTFSPEEID